MEAIKDILFKRELDKEFGDDEELKNAIFELSAVYEDLVEVLKPIVFVDDDGYLIEEVTDKIAVFDMDNYMVEALAQGIASAAKGAVATAGAMAKEKLGGGTQLGSMELKKLFQTVSAVSKGEQPKGLKDKLEKAVPDILQRFKKRLYKQHDELKGSGDADDFEEKLRNMIDELRKNFRPEDPIVNTADDFAEKAKGAGKTKYALAAIKTIGRNAIKNHEAKNVASKALKYASDLLNPPG